MQHSERLFALCAEQPDREQLILLAGLSVLWLRPQNPQARDVLNRYRDRDFAVAALRETALQLLLLAGFQTSLEAAYQIKDVFGAGLPSDEDELRALHAQTWLERGYALQAQVYCGSVEKLRANLSATSRELEAWTVLVGYGLVMSRRGLPAAWRELLEVVVLAVQDFPRQLHSHLRGAVNLGAAPEEVELILRIADIFAGDEASRSAWQIWQQIRQQVCHNDRYNKC